jgi:hypothetical protein
VLCKAVNRNKSKFQSNLIKAKGELLTEFIHPEPAGLIFIQTDHCKMGINNSKSQPTPTETGQIAHAIGIKHGENLTPMGASLRIFCLIQLVKHNTKSENHYE